VSRLSWGYGRYTTLVRLTELYLRHYKFVADAQQGLGGLMTGLQGEETQASLAELLEKMGSAQT